MKWTMRPLTLFEQDSDLPPLGYEVVDESGAPVFDNQTYYPGPPTPEQAAHIVHCVNGYEDMEKKLKDAVLLVWKMDRESTLTGAYSRCAICKSRRIDGHNKSCDIVRVLKSAGDAP